MTRQQVGTKDIDWWRPSCLLPQRTTQQAMSRVDHVTGIVLITQFVALAILGPFGVIPGGLAQEGLAQASVCSPDRASSGGEEWGRRVV